MLLNEPLTLVLRLRHTDIMHGLVYTIVESTAPLRVKMYICSTVTRCYITSSLLTLLQSRPFQPFQHPELPHPDLL